MRLTTATHSARESRPRFGGGQPRAPGEVAHRCANAAGEHEAHRGRAGCDERQTALQLAGDVRRVSERVAEVVDSLGELLALGLEVGSDLVGGAVRVGVLIS